MDSFLQAILPCLQRKRGIQLPTTTGEYQYISEKLALQTSPPGDEKWTLRNDEAASSIVCAISDADQIGPSLHATIQSHVHAAGGWSDYLAKKIVSAMEAVLKAAEPLKGPMQEMKDKAEEALKATEGFATDHPVWTAIVITVIALGILVLVAPYAVEWLGFCAGFGELGPIEGKSRFLAVRYDDECALILATRYRLLGSLMAV